MSCTNLCLCQLYAKKFCFSLSTFTYEGVCKSFRIDRVERELQMVQLSATRCSCIAILRVSLGSFAAITLCVACLFRYDSVRKLLDTPSYVTYTNEPLHCGPILNHILVLVYR
jgi:hypothetical protein